MGGTGLCWKIESCVSVILQLKCLLDIPKKTSVTQSSCSGGVTGKIGIWELLERDGVESNGPGWGDVQRARGEERQPRTESWILDSGGGARREADSE